MKFLLVGAVSVVISWGLGKYLVSPHPVAAVGLMLAAFGIMAII